MKSLRFSTKLSNPHADVLVITPAQTVCELPLHHTIYLATMLTPGQFDAILEHTELGSVVVVYGEWKMYERVLRARADVTNTVNQYGEGGYPHSKN